MDMILATKFLLSKLAKNSFLSNADCVSLKKAKYIFENSVVEMKNFK